MESGEGELHFVLRSTHHVVLQRVVELVYFVVQRGRHELELVLVERTEGPSLPVLAHFLLDVPYTAQYLAQSLPPYILFHLSLHVHQLTLSWMSLRAYRRCCLRVLAALMMES